MSGEGVTYSFGAAASNPSQDAYRQLQEAESLFAQYLACLGPTGLMPEMYDPVEERGLGNHPQAYSHLGLIRCAQLLSAQ